MCEHRAASSNGGKDKMLDFGIVTLLRSDYNDGQRKVLETPSFCIENAARQAILTRAFGRKAKYR